MRAITFAAFDTLCTISIFGEKGEDGSLPGEGRKDKCFIGKQGEEACLPGQEKEAFLLEQAKALVLSVQDTLNMYDPSSELSGCAPPIYQGSLKRFPLCCGNSSS